MSKTLNWIQLTSVRRISVMQNHILDTYGRLTEQDFKDAYKSIEKYFRTWDDKVDYSSNGDRQYAPTVFVWYYRKKLNGKSNVPIVIMREIYHNLKHLLKD
jgi:hypothetical protein